jgi:integrase
MKPQQLQLPRSGPNGQPVESSHLEQTKVGLAFKSPKTTAGRRTIAISPHLVAELREHRRNQHERRFGLGMGKAGLDDLVFPRWDGEPLRPNAVTKEWRRNVATLNLPRVSLHALRHSHASHLLASGVDILTISRRLGHGAASITLNVYSHLIHGTDDKAAAVMQAVFGDAARK